MTFTQWPSKPLRSQQKISSRKSTLRTSSVSRTALGVRHPKFWGNDQTYFPGVDRIQTILVLLKSIYVQVDLKFELMVIHSHRTKQGWPSQSTTTEFKIRSFLKNEVLKCWRSYKYHVHLPFIYIYLSVFNLKKTNCCAVVPCSFWCWWWHVGKPPKSPTSTNWSGTQTTDSKPGSNETLVVQLTSFRKSDGWWSKDHEKIAILGSS